MPIAQIGRKSDEQQLEPLYFEFKGRVADLLGAQSVSDRFVALNELVKNAYDADATLARIKFENVRTGSPTLVITDNGNGMSAYELQNEWMIVGTDSKIRDPYTKKFKRRKLGHKGIGRFAIQTLARVAEVISRPEGETAGYRLVFNWVEYDQPNSRMTSIPNQLFKFPKRKDEHGMEIRLSDLRAQWTEDDIQRLTRNIKMIIPPNVSGTKFNPSIVAEEFANYPGKLRSELLKQAVFTFKGHLDKTGRITYVFESKKGGKSTYKETMRDFTCGPVDFTLFFYYRDKDKLAEHGIRVDDIDSFCDTLDEFGGVKLYRNNLRVTGFGDPGDDWLQLDALRVNYPTIVPSNNQIIGFVRITAEGNPQIVDTTMREGIIKTKAFEDLRDFIRASVKFFADRRAESEGKRKKARKRKKTEIKKTVKTFTALQEPIKFLDFRSRYPMVFYKPLEEEINAAAIANLPNATLILCRKMAENLLYNLLEFKFPNEPGLWYGSNRALDFSVLEQNLRSRKHLFPANEVELIDKLLSYLKKFRREANRNTHKIFEYAEKQEELASLKIPEIVELELMLIERVRGLTAPIPS